MTYASHPASYGSFNASHRATIGVVALSLSQTLSDWQLIENRKMLLCDEGSLQAHWVDDCQSDPVESNA
jgi:hypothetical protein